MLHHIKIKYCSLRAKLTCSVRGALYTSTLSISSETIDAKHPSKKGLDAVLAEKPLDLLNFFEYCDKIQSLNQKIVFIIDGSENSNAVQSLCIHYKLEYFVLKNPDMYKISLKKLLCIHKSRTRPFIILFKISLKSISLLYWWIILAKSALFSKKIILDRLVLDSWRSKIAFIPFFKINSLIFIDGGYSTKTYNLVRAFTLGGARNFVIKSLKQQEPLYVTPYRLFIRKHIPIDSQLFSAYFDKILQKEIPRFLRNEFLWSKKVFEEKPVSETILIMGNPNFANLISFVNIAKKINLKFNSKNKIVYRLHPVDSEKINYSSHHSESLIKQHSCVGIDISHPRFGLEFDLIQSKQIPLIIISYPSSAIVWLHEVLADRCQVLVI